MHKITIKTPLHTFPAEKKRREEAATELARAEQAILDRALALPHVADAAKIAGYVPHQISKPTARVESGWVLVDVFLDMKEVLPDTPAPAAPPVKPIPRVNLDITMFNTLMNGKMLNDTQKARLLLAQLGSAADFILGEGEKT